MGKETRSVWEDELGVAGNRYKEYFAMDLEVPGNMN